MAWGSTAQADNATVGNGTPASCTEAALNAALTQVVVGDQAPGGVLTFACGTQPHAIVVTSQKSLEGQVTIDGGGLITLDGQYATRHFNVFRTQPEDQTAVLLKDITLRNGYADYGGSVYVGEGTRLDLLRATFVSSIAAYTGGAVASAGSSLLNVNASVFYTGSAQAGGAIASYGVANIADSVFSSNFAYSSQAGGISHDGGAIASFIDSLLVERSQFLGNVADYGGAISNNGTQATLRDCRFVGNSASMGGALYFEASSNPALIAGGHFENNAAEFFGGAINSSAPLNVDRSLFKDNRASAGGAVDLFSSGNSVLARSTFSGNTANFGGAILGSGTTGLSGTLNLSQVTTSGNSASSGNGGDLYLLDGFGIGVQVFDSTLMNASAASGSSLYVGQDSVVRVGSSLVWASNGVACTVAAGGQLTTLDHNVAPASCGFGAASDLIVASFAQFGLGALADNGGGLPTFLPRPGSPAIDRRIGCSAAEDGDARRLPRPADGDGNGSLDCDAGAVERQPVEVVDDRIFADGFQSP